MFQELRSLCKNNSYFTNDDSEKVQFMTDIELLCEALAATEINELNQQLSQSCLDKNKAKQYLSQKVLYSITIIYIKIKIFFKISLVKNKVEKERQDVQSNLKGDLSSGSECSSKIWHPDDLQVLIKAVNLFPAGTNKR